MPSVGNLVTADNSFTYRSKTYTKRDIKSIDYYKKGNFVRIISSLQYIVMFFLIYTLYTAYKLLFSSKVMVLLTMREHDNDGKKKKVYLWMSQEEAELLQHEF